MHLSVITMASIVLGLFLKQTFKSDWFEFAGLITGVVGVYLVAVEHIINWPAGLVNVALQGYVFFTGRLFADMSLQVFFFILGIQGWYLWLRGGTNHSSLKIATIPFVWWLWIGMTMILGTAIYVPIITHFKGAVPFVDSVLTVASIIAQLLLNAKKIENWILWILVDIAYVPLYISRGFYSFAVLYALFLGLAVAGLYNWIKTYRQESATAPV